MAMKEKTRHKMWSALTLRDSGLTYAAIGEALGVSKGRAWQLVLKGRRMAARAEALSKLAEMDGHYL